VEGLAAQLGDADWQKRADAARRLGATRRPDAVALLAGAVGDKDARVRLAVVRACGAHQSPKLIPALKKALADDDRKVRVHAVRALARIGTRDAAEAMIEALDGASMWLRPAVADALAALPVQVISGLEVAIQVLVAELDPKQTQRFRRLATALASIGEPALGALLRAMNKPAGPHAKKHVLADIGCKRGPCQVLVTLGVKVLPTLLRMARGGIQGLIRTNLYHVLLPVIVGRIGKAAIPHVIVHIGRYDDESKLAESTLSRMGAAAVQPLVKLLRKRGQIARVRTAAVRVLGKIDNKRSTKVLLEVLLDPDRDVHEAAARALAASPTAKTFKALAKRLKSGSKPQRLVIVQGARSGSGEMATRLLILALVQGEVDVAVAAAQALGARRHKQAAVRALLQALKRRSGKLRQAAVRALGYLKGPKVYKTLARLARRGNKALRLAAIRGLGDLGTKPAKKLLKRLARSRNKAIAKAAADALDPASLAMQGLPKIGIPVCDRYLAAFACYVGKMPAATRGPALNAFKKTIAAWKKMASGPARSSIGRACTMALQAFHKMPQFRSCLRP
jgi:HEAT repeat protein